MGDQRGQDKVGSQATWATGWLPIAKPFRPVARQNLEGQMAGAGDQLGEILETDGSQEP